MDQYVLLVSIMAGLDAVGPFGDFESAAREADVHGRGKTLVLSMRAPMVMPIGVSIGEVSDLLQALAKASALLYEEEPLRQYDSVPEALKFIAHSIDEPLVREHMLSIMGVRHDNRTG